MTLLRLPGFLTAAEAGLLSAELHTHGARRTQVDGRDLPAVRGLLTDLRDRAVSATIAFYRAPGLHPEFTLLTAMPVGDSHALHADSERRRGDGWEPNHTPQRAYTAMVYLNTHGADFDGGLIRFPTLGVEVAPEAGLLVGFPCHHEYEHEVTPVVRGERHAVSLWMTANPDRQEAW